ncbi:toxin Cry1Ac domain D-VI-related protein [Listeria sp. ILCC797]|uniref:toxin Cry1Ac domain D-VI-related protein n=1 Tax=Listeria sp. ILCC797 TaxID=1918333 RepID=UPI000B592EDA|nr:toxin Cry1Ac domain D-VI-related protein [Listeria sp. ILCC797]
MKGKKIIWFVVSGFLMLVVLVSVVLVKHQEAVQAVEEKEEARKVALEQEMALEKNATSAVERLFASETEELLSDTYSEDLKTKAEQLVQQLANKKMKANLKGKLTRVDKFVSQISANQLKVNTLFSNEQKKTLAQNVTREDINSVKKAVTNGTLQTKSKKEQLADVQKAYDLLIRNEELQKAATSSSAESQADKNSNDVQSSAKESATSVQESPESKSSKSNSNNSSGAPSASSTNIPTVAKMKLASQTNQIITVVASGTSANVKFWEKSGETWKQVFSTYGQVGSQGVGSADEYHSRTPKGAYSLGFAFGTSNPGTSLAFRQITNQSYWISNVKDNQYNTWQERNSSSSADEHMASYPVQYRYGVVINYNTSRTKGAGSGFFLHCSNGAPTAGCVAIPTSQMATVLQKLHSGAYIVNVTSEQELLQY